MNEEEKYEYFMPTKERLKQKIAKAKASRQFALEQMQKAKSNMEWQYWCDEDFWQLRNIRKLKHELLKIAERNYFENSSNKE